MDDRVRLGREHGPAHGAGVEQIELDRLRSESTHMFGISRRFVGADHLVPVGHQLRNEPGSDRAARACYEDLHRVLLSRCHIGGISGVYTYDPTRRRFVTDG